MRSPAVLATASAVLGVGLVVVLANGGSQSQPEVTISLPGIPGPYCMYGIEKRLAEMPEVEGVRLLWEEDAIRVGLKSGATVTRQAFEEAIERAEYPYEYSVEP